MDRTVLEIIEAAPLYRDLTPGEAAEMAGGLELRRFAAGEPLMVQGAASDGAYVIAQGQVLVATRLPGGGETQIAILGPGDLVGEMALLMRGGRRTATARAHGEVQTLFIDRRFFEAGLHLLRPSSLKVLRRLGLTIAERLRRSRGRSRALVEDDPDPSLFRPVPTGQPHVPGGFDVRAFLPALPRLRDFQGDELDALFAMARVEDVPRGAALVEEREAVQAPRLVVRGALLLGQRRESRVHQLDILGPGRFAGVAPVLEGAAAGAAIMAAEDSTLLAFDVEPFLEVWRGAERLSLRLLDAINGDLVQSLETADKHLARLTAQARVRELVGGA